MGRACFIIQLIAILWVAAGCDDSGSNADGAATDLPVPDQYAYKLDQGLQPPEQGVLDAIVPQRDTATDTGSSNGHVAPVFLDFDVNDGQLIGTGDWEWGNMNFSAGTNCDTSAYAPPSKGHSGSGLWRTVLNDCYRPLNNALDPCDNIDVKDDSTLQFVVHIPSAFKSAGLTYWEWADYFLTFDWTEVRVNGTVLRQTCTGSLPQKPSWERQTIDISQFIGQTVTISFHFMASEVVNQAGWYLDDLAVGEF
jgi:hypothetical protein